MKYLFCILSATAAILAMDTSNLKPISITQKTLAFYKDKQITLDKADYNSIMALPGSTLQPLPESIITVSMKAITLLTLFSPLSLKLGHQVFKTGPPVKFLHIGEQFKIDVYGQDELSQLGAKIVNDYKNSKIPVPVPSKNRPFVPSRYPDEYYEEGENDCGGEQ